MAKVYYGFNNETKACVWTADGKTAPMAGITVIVSDISYQIADIEMEMLDGVASIKTRVVSDAELMSAAESERTSKLSYAANKISVLTDVAEFEPSEEATAELTAWRKYRAALYTLTIDDPTSVEWPVIPE